MYTNRTNRPLPEASTVADYKKVDVSNHISRSLQNLQHSDSENSRRVGNAEFATHQEPSIRKASKHRRCQSQSLAPIGAAGLTVPNPKQYGRSLSANEQANEESPICIHDEAVSLEDMCGARGQRSDGMLPRLVVVSGRVRGVSVLRHALLPGVCLVQYNYDSSSLYDILSSVAQMLNGRLVHSVAFVLSCSGATLQLTSADDKVITADSLSDKSLLDFFLRLKEQYCSKEASSGLRFDFLACLSIPPAEMAILAAELENKLGVPVGVWRDMIGADIISKQFEDASGSNICVGELYFRLEKLRTWSGQQPQSLSGFEKIRTVGKGAYGAAVLYKKKDDDSLVILKEINMHDLTATQRQLALNEVKVLAMLDHPNIISYYDSFEEDGLLMIEMEYADGGTLAQFLAQQDPSQPGQEREREILGMFQQIVAAIRHIHQHNILHRDLKTDNIFLTKEGVVKVGDFGISKMLGSANNGAQTVLGTPYYISPEMCEGKAYSYKSDIWALGCILYEMACLQKTFEGTNLPALVNKIMQGQFAPVKGNFTAEFKQLVSDMLQRDPDLRPSANDILYSRLLQLMSRYEDSTSEAEEDVSASAESVSRKAKIRSVLYYFELSSSNMSCILGLPLRMKIKQVGVSSDHVVVVTTERQVYSWGRGDKGQLGHGDTQGRPSPCLVEALKGKSIAMVCCGEDFTVFGSDNGLVLTCGDGTHGCLGHGDWSSALKPRLIEALLSVDVVVVSCGPHHVVVLGREGVVYTWGQNDKGQLGLGSEEHQCQPVKVDIQEPVVMAEVACGMDGTMMLTDVGRVFACGSNEHNKLGLNHRQGFLMAMKNMFAKTEVEGTSVPILVRALARHRVVAIAMGRHHSAVIVEAGHVYTFGRNAEGQLGTGNTKVVNTPIELKSPANVAISLVRCGDHYTVASNKEHQLFYWGLRFKDSLPCPPADTDSATTNTNSVATTTTDEGSSRSSISSIPVEMGVKGGAAVDGTEEVTPRNVGPVKIAERDLRAPERPEDPNLPQASATTTNTSPPMASNQADSGVSMATGGSEEGTGLDTGSLPSPSTLDSASGFRPLSHTTSRRTWSAGSRDQGRETDKDKDVGKDDSVIIFKPVEIIRIKPGPEKVLLGNVFCHGENLFIQVETTAPPPRRRTFKKRSFRRRPQQQTEAGKDPKQMSNSSHEAGDEYSSEASEIDSRSRIPTWLKKELSATAGGEDSCPGGDIEDDGNEADDTSDLSDEEGRNCGVVDGSMSSIHINKVLIAANPAVDKAQSPQSVQQNLLSGRHRTGSVNSAGSNPDKASAEHMSDSSSSETAATKGNKGRHSHQHLALAAGSRSRASSAKVTPRARSAGRGKAKSHEDALKEKLTARGFVSDVTVKRREEALLCELELMREEKSKAEAQLQALQKERELQAEKLREEAEQIAKKREQKLIAELERLRQELEWQSSQLAERQQLVGHLQQQLHQQHGKDGSLQPPKDRTPSSAAAVPRQLPEAAIPNLLLPLSSSPTPTSTTRSSGRGDQSARSTRSMSAASKVCNVQ